MWRDLANLIFVLFVVIFLWYQGANGAPAPTDEIKSAIEAVRTVLKDPNFKGEAKKDARRKALSQALRPHFDFAEMSKRALGGNWKRFSEAEQKEFVMVFSDFLEANYISEVESLGDERFDYSKEVIDGTYAEIRSKIRTTKGDEIKIDYKLHFSGGRWKVYDVSIENVSVVNNYRAQFNRVLERYQDDLARGFDELIKKIKEAISRLKNR